MKNQVLEFFKNYLGANIVGVKDIKDSEKAGVFKSLFALFGIYLELGSYANFIQQN